MPNTVTTTLPGTLISQIEVATITAAGAAYIKNPVAGRAILQAAAAALFEPPVGVALTAAIALAVAAYCVSQWGNDPVVGTLPTYYVSPTYASGIYQFEIPNPNYPTQSNPTIVYGPQTNPSIYTKILFQPITGSPTQGQVYLWNGSQWVFYIVSAWPNGYPRNIIANGATDNPQVLVPASSYPALTDDEKTLIGQVGTVTIPRAIPKKPATADDPKDRKSVV